MIASHYYCSNCSRSRVLCRYSQKITPEYPSGIRLLGKGDFAYGFDYPSDCSCSDRLFPQLAANTAIRLMRPLRRSLPPPALGG